MSSENNVKSKDLALVNDLNAALQKEKHSGQFWVIMLFFIFLVVFVIWAYNSPIEEVTRGQGNVIPSSREQVVQSIDPGIIMEMKVKEGEIVEKDQILLKLDDTRSSAIWRESEAKVQNLEAMVARLKAEAYGTELSFPKGISNELKQREHAAFVARRRAVVDAIQGLSISKATLDKEISITAPMVAQGVVSEVELLRMQRESSDLALQIAERRNRYMADANNELVQAESELAQAKENMAMRADPVDRSLIRAPMRGIVKNIEINTVGGVVNVGQDILTIVPLDDKLLVEAYIRPQDVAFMSPGLPAVVKISAYDYAIYGGLDGKVTLISPDTMSNNNQPRANDLKLDPNQVYYRILVQTDSNSLKDKNGKDMPIIPGMVATVDVKTGEKTVFQYLIKPITRMKQALREAAAQPRQKREASVTVRKLFVLLHGAYGSLFLSKYATGEKNEAGGDKGVAAAMLVWDSAMAKFAPEVIEAAVKRLMAENPEFAPNLPQLEKVCEAITPRKTYAEEVGLPRLPAPAPAAPLKVDFSKQNDGKDWARSILARAGAGDTIRPSTLLSARQALGMEGRMSWQ